jgi:hypothetical protein
MCWCFSDPTRINFKLTPGQSDSAVPDLLAP